MKVQRNSRYCPHLAQISTRLYVKLEKMTTAKCEPKELSNKMSAINLSNLHKIIRNKDTMEVIA